MLIIYIEKESPGWFPINYMVNLLGKLLEAKVLAVESRKLNFLEKLETLLSKRKRGDIEGPCLLICPTVHDLWQISQVQNYHNFSSFNVWIIDSFWTEHIPLKLMKKQIFNHIYITTKEDIPLWTKKTNTEVSFLPWGSDVFNMGGNNEQRKFDLLRVGRQPKEWNNDTLTKQLCNEHNLTFMGRPSFDDNPENNTLNLTNIYKQSKFLLAFSNLVDGSTYTHPTKEYITARWVDALACGAIVAGVSPKSLTAQSLLWKGATLEFDTVERQKGFRVLLEALQEWHPRQSYKNYLYSLKNLDWRWRFAVLARDFNQKSKTLDREIRLLKEKIRIHEASYDPKK